MADEGVQYRFLSVIGEGGFGKVYRARLETGEGFHKEVAVKVLSDPSPPSTLLQRFKDEAKILGLLRDRAIVGAEPPIRVGDRWAVVMEFVDGVSCGALVDKGRLPAGVAVEIVGEVARALHNAYHMPGPEGGPLHLLHRDIKPDNIQITPAGDVRILDFGIAKANFAAREFKTRHSLGGTPGYIAPERLMRVEEPQGDIYSLGVVLHELVTGKRPGFPPTLSFDLEVEGDRGGSLPPALPSLDLEQLEIDPELLDQPLVAEVLTLAAWMRNDDHAERPSARQVEELCRGLRPRLPPPYLRDWAEQHVPSRVELDADAMVGRVLTTGSSTLNMTPAPPLAQPVSVAPQVSATATTEHGRNPTEVALGAFIGGGAALLFASVVMGAVIVALVAVILARGPADPSAVPDVVVAPTPEPPEPPLPPAAEPEPEPAPPTPPPPVTPPPPAPAPAPPTARPAPPRPPPAEAPPPNPRVITLEPERAPTPGSDPIRPPQVRTAPTGMVVVRTVPTGATVSVRGQPLERTGRGYALPSGSHLLEVTSPTGEQTRIPVQVKVGATIEICYSFDTNSACGS